MTKFNKDFITEFISFSNYLEKHKICDVNDFRKMFINSFLKEIKEDIILLKSIFIYNSWMEVDKPIDLNHSEFNKNKLKIN